MYLSFIDAITTLKKHLNYKDVAYTFTLTVGMNNEYIKTAGSPTEGIDRLVVISDSPTKKINIK